MTELVDRLISVLEARVGEIQMQSDYYNGDRPHLYLPDRSHPLYMDIVSMARSPWAALAIQACAERMKVTGFRIVTQDEADTDVESDGLAWDIWQSNQGDMYSQVAFRTMLLHGVCYAIVEEGPDLPIISFEHPLSVATLTAPGGRGVVAAIKRWQENDQDVSVVWTSSGAQTMFRDRSQGLARWEISGDQLAANASGEVPVFALRNKPDLLGGYDSDLSGLYSTLDRAAQSLVDRLTVQYWGSTRIRWITGVTPELNEDGTPADSMIKMSTDRLLMVESPDARLGSMEASDLRQFIEVARSDISALASLTRLPAILFSGIDLVNVSSESIRALSQGLVSRIEEKITCASPALSQAMRLALRMAGDERVADPRTRVEPIWAPALEPTASETALAAQQLVAGGILSPTAAQDIVLGLTPSERDKAAQYMREDQLNAQGAQVIAGLFAPETGTVPTSAPEEEVVAGA